VNPLGATVVDVIHNALDEYGGRTETGRDSYPGCSVQPVSSTEQLSTGDQTVSRWVLYGPPSLVAEPVDQLAADGITYEVDGEIQLWRDLDGTPHHVEAFLRRVTG
jgi:hypothetical protein